uniref:Uncharacterized protein n=1 Tax=Timema shepardi TaxID=629360 RepID=A0A7R9AXZ9_TIMSH|nr:unnamed protein product [Timema shepardi]
MVVTSPVSPHDTPAPSEKIVRNKKRPRDGLPEQRQRGREKKTFVEYETLRGFFGSRYFLDISPRFSLCCHRLAMLILLDDLQDAGVGSSDEGQQGEGSSDEGQQGEEDDDDILPEHPSELAQTVLPMSGRLNDRRTEEAQGRETDGPHQGDDGPQVGHRYSYRHCRGNRN